MVSAYFIMGIEDLSLPFAIREEVFINEQGFSKELEQDAMDKRALHAVAVAEDTPCATGRLFFGDDGAWHIGRMAVLKQWRGQHMGDLVMRMLLSQALKAGASEVRLGAQEYACGFYEKFGFLPCGEPFDDEGCAHIPMRATAERINSVLKGNCSGSCAGCTACSPDKV